MSLNAIRANEYNNLEKALIDLNGMDVWVFFISSDLDVKYKLMLGSTYTTFCNISNVNDYYHVFDKFCKSFSKRAWKARFEMKCANNDD